MRFCMVTTFYPPYAFGGDGVFVHRLTNMLARSGHEVDVIHCLDSYRALAKRPPSPGYPNEPSVTLHGLASAVGILSPLATQQTGYPLFKTRRIRSIMAAGRYDVIHFHNVSLVGGPRILTYGGGIKLYTIHDHWLICPIHTLLRSKREACTKRTCFRCQLVYRRPPQLWRLTGLLAAAVRHVDAFISPTQFTLRRHLADGLDVPIVHIPHFPGCSTERSAPPPGVASALPPRPFFLFVGRLEKLKGLQTVIPLFRDRAVADLVVVGDGDYAGELMKLAEGSSRIHFLGQLSPAQLGAIYAGAVALLVPSITFEVGPLVVLEAFAVRTPVIVRDLGPLPETVAESGGGLVFRDSAGLLAAMQRLLADPGLRDRLGEAGYRSYRDRWTEEAHLERYFGLIEDLRARKRVAGGHGELELS